jgi:hypothetical protein
MEYEAVIVTLRSREALRVHHELDRFNPLARRGNARIGRRGRPHSQTNRGDSSNNGKQSGFAHLSSPVQFSSKTRSNIPDHGFGRCDGHHEVVDFRPRNGPVFAHACKLGLEGIVSKRKNSPYRSGRFPDWLKMKNPNAARSRRGL